MKFYILASVLLLSFISSSHASVLNKKGKWSVYYGYNRAEYSNSDYHLTGDGYDFTLKGVSAKDRQSDIGADPYANPFAWSVPQNNIRFSYFLTDNFAISFGNDHMKYVMDTYQTVDIDGSINISDNTIYNKDYTDAETIDINPAFLTFEHTDGLNYVSVEFEHFIPLWLSSKGTHAFSAFWGPGIGLMYPKTNARLFSRPQNDEFHIAGSGYSIKVGVEYIFERWFTRLVTKFGHIDMNDAKTTADSTDTLSHKFDFTETYLAIGFYF
ncbi:MAG: hypothetical protein KAT06_05140 [Gammaproteobacteria bacterium]|nr:hypothetical protein [Gammaproteobacteria bacterium]